jgi:cell division protein FtsQ
MSDPTSPLQQFDGPSVDPRFRRRWAEARRAEGRRRLKILLSALVGAAVAGGCLGLLYSPVFRVRHVVVIGNTHTPVAQVLAAAGMTTGSGAVLMVDSGPPSAQRALDALPWVAVATFERRWPWTVVIKVKERSPVARVLTGGGVDVVDKTGRVLEVRPTGPAVGSAPKKPTMSLPLVTGVRGAPAGYDVSPGVGVTGTDVDALLAAAAAAPQALAKRNLRLAYSAANGLVGYIGPTNAPILLGDASDLSFKLAVLEELATRVDLASYAQVDLTVPERPALTPLPSGVLGVG